MCYNAAIVSIIFKTLFTGEAFPDKIQKPVVRNLSLHECLQALFGQSFSLVAEHDIPSVIVTEALGVAGHVGPGGDAECGSRHGFV